MRKSQVLKGLFAILTCFALLALANCSKSEQSSQANTQSSTISKGDPQPVAKKDVEAGDDVLTSLYCKAYNFNIKDGVASVDLIREYNNFDAADNDMTGYVKDYLDVVWSIANNHKDVSSIVIDYIVTGKANQYGKFDEGHFPLGTVQEDNLSEVRKYEMYAFENSTDWQLTATGKIFKAFGDRLDQYNRQ